MNGHLRPTIFLANFSCVRVLVHKPKLIVCDEPTSHLITRPGGASWNFLRQVAERPDRALIVVTHHPRIFEFGDRTARIDDGIIMEVLNGPSKEHLQ